MMKKLRNVLSAVLLAAFAVCVALFAASCDSTYYTVTAEYNAEAGQVTLSPSAHAEGYEKGETVEVTVTPNEGYTVKGVTVNGDAKEGETFSFEVTGDTVVKAEFEESTREYLLVTLDVRGQDMGTVTVSAPKDGNDAGHYAAGETVTITVTPKEGCLVAAVVVNRKQVTLTAGVYTFTIEADSTVTVSFAVDDSDLPDLSTLIGGTFGASWVGEWTSADGVHKLHISDRRMSLDDEPVTGASVSSTTSGEGYELTIGTDGYILEWAEPLYSSNYVISLFKQGAQERNYFVRTEDRETPPTIEEKYRGTWYLGEQKALEITEHTISYMGKTADAVVDGGYYEVSNDGYNAPIDSHIYYFIIEDSYYRLSWYPDGSQPVVGDDYFTSQPHVDRVLPDRDWIGQWQGVGSETRELTITETQVLVDGEEAKLVRGVMHVGIRLGNVDYEIYMVSDYAIYFRQYTYSEETGLPKGYTDGPYFMKKDHPTDVTFPDYMCGTWKAAGQNALTITETSIRWGDVEGIILGKTQLGGDGGDVAGASAISTLAASVPAEGETFYFYTVALGNVVYTLGYDPESQTVNLSGGKLNVTFMGETIPASLQGTWEMGDVTMTIGSENITFDGQTYTPSMGEGGLVFTVGNVQHTLSTNSEYGVTLLADSHEGTVDYYLSSNFAAPSVTVEAELLGYWKRDDNLLFLGSNTVTFNGTDGVLLQYDDASVFYVFYAGGKLYSVRLEGTKLRLAFAGDSEPGALYDRTEAPSPVLLPAAYRGTEWTSVTGESVKVDAGGGFF